MHESKLKLIVYVSLIRTMLITAMYKVVVSIKVKSVLVQQQETGDEKGVHHKSTIMQSSKLSHLLPYYISALCG